MSFWDMFLYVLFAAAVTVGAIHGSATYVEVEVEDGIHLDAPVQSVSWRR